MNNNDEIWKELSRPPKDALKTIKAGRTKGMTDINPQWRYEAMTKVFGVCGVGWKFEIVSIWIDEGSHEQRVQNVKVLLYIKDAGGWSDPIPGVGGSMLVAKESAGLRTNDEAVKMATTDALSTSMKMVGVASDIYRGTWDGTKYKDSGKNPNPPWDEAADVKFYKSMAEFKAEFGEEEYKSILESRGIQKSEDIPTNKRAGALKFFAEKLEILKTEGGR